CVFFFFFFFQAEDGIRDLTVTGVQTCALPISIASSSILCRNLTTGASSSSEVAPLSSSPVDVSMLDSSNSKSSPMMLSIASVVRSEERRVGKECRCRWAPDREKKNKVEHTVDR